VAGVDPITPEADAGPGADLTARLRQALAEALRARDPIAVSALRSALGAIGNAEAVEPGAAAAAGFASPAGPGSPHVAGAAAGVGAAEVARRTLAVADIEQIVRAEAAEREQAAHGYERSGHADRAGRLRREAQVLRSVLSGEERTAGDDRGGQ
jgi:uncharacterized protein